MTGTSLSDDATGAAARLWVVGETGTGKSALVAQLVGATEGSAGNPSETDVVVLVVDAAQGFNRAARQQAAMARTCGARHLVLAINKLELLGWDRDAYGTAAQALADFVDKFEFGSATAIPVSALHGDNVSAPSTHTPWYAGPGLKAHIAALDTGAVPSKSPEAVELTEQFAAHLAWLAPEGLLPGREYALTVARQAVTASVTGIKYRLDVDSLRREPARTLEPGEIGAVTIATAAPVAVDDASRFVLSELHTGVILGAGTVDFALRRGLNIHLQQLSVTKELRASLKRQRPCIVLFTGLSGAGKSTIANLVEGNLVAEGGHTYLLDGDNIRHGLNKDLGFTPADRVENIRRVGEVARLFVDAGMIVLCSFISPFRAERAAIRSLVEPTEYLEVYVKAPLAVCEERDPKGLYAKSRAGLLPNFTGIDLPYEVPEAPDLVLDTTSAAPEVLALRVLELFESRGITAAQSAPLAAARGV